MGLLVARTRPRIRRAPKETLAASACRPVAGQEGSGLKHREKWAPSMRMKIVKAVLLLILATDVVVAQGPS